MTSRAASWLRFGLSHPGLLIKRIRMGRRAFSDAPWRTLASEIAWTPVILEAGAADGADTLRLQAMFPGAKIYAVEPVPSAFAELEERTRDLKNVVNIPVALSNQNGTAFLNVAMDTASGSADSSSLLTPLEHSSIFPSVKFESRIPVRGLTIDSLISQNELEWPDFLWLDLQGMEIAVLRSSPGTVARVRAIYMEVSRRPLYEGMPLFREVVKAMAEWGFTIRVNQVGPISGNALFMR
jgi:FkbM family methyltransferase